MKRFLNYLFIALFAIILNSACGNNESDNNGMSAESDSLSVIPVEVATTGRGDIAAYYTTTTTLEAEQEAIVVAQVRGIATRLMVEEGDQVSKDQVIAKLEDDQYRIEASRAKATLDRLYNDFQRNKELFEKNLLSAEAYENSRFEYESQKAAYELAELNLKNTEIRSPISGLVSERFIKAGNMVSMDEQIYKVTDFEPLQAILYVPEHELSKLRKNQQALLSVDALPTKQFTGHVQRISPVVDPATGTFKVTVQIEDESGQLRPGMFGRIKIVYDTHTNTLMIPKAAIINEDVNQTVFVVRGDTVYKKNIITGYANGVNVEVLSGLDDGEMVVTVGQGSLIDSAKVTVVSF
jgi:membrane fusion protein (multidrug efflux system)